MCHTQRSPKAAADHQPLCYYLLGLYITSSISPTSPRVFTRSAQPRLKPATSWSWIRHPTATPRRHLNVFNVLDTNRHWEPIRHRSRQFAIHTITDAASTFGMCHTLQVSDSCRRRFYIYSRISPRRLFLLHWKLVLFLNCFPQKDQAPFSIYAPQRNPL